MTAFAVLLLWAPSLFEQLAVKVLQRDFPQAQFLLADVATGEEIGRRWIDPDRAIPLGSLVKPFLLVDNPGTARCNPAQCWLSSGHGEVGLSDAIALSCNSYFLQKLTGAVRYRLPPPETRAPNVWIGLGSGWLLSPRRMAAAYAALAVDSGASLVHEGMRRSARSGTARLLHADALAKTGTAPCSHARKAPGDGYVAILYPPVLPRYVLLVQVHGVSGAVAASTAGAMLKVLRDGK